MCSGEAQPFLCPACCRGRVCFVPRVVCVLSPYPCNQTFRKELSLLVRDEAKSLHDTLDPKNLKPVLRTRYCFSLSVNRFVFTL